MKATKRIERRLFTCGECDDEFMWDVAIYSDEPETHYAVGIPRCPACDPLPFQTRSTHDAWGIPREPRSEPTGRGPLADARRRFERGDYAAARG